MKTERFDFKLPDELIAQAPSNKRDQSRLMVCDPVKNSIQDKKFHDIIDLLDDQSVLVLNNTKVINARLKGTKKTGAAIEVFLLEELETNSWKCLVKPTKRINEGDIIEFTTQLKGEIIKKGRFCKIKFLAEKNVIDFINEVGEPPLPQYIKCSNPKQFEERYQTVFAKNVGSVAAPTAGLHFTDELIAKLQYKGVQIEYVTLHVGYGTFKGIETTTIDEHQMHKEMYYIDQDVADRLNKLKKDGKNIISVGTTSARTLESAAENNIIKAGSGSSTLFIKPGYSFQFIDALITNFHLPKSSLFVLVSTIAGVEFMSKAYKEAIKNKYRFYSFGDAMFITRRQ